MKNEVKLFIIGFFGCLTAAISSILGRRRCDIFCTGNPDVKEGLSAVERQQRDQAEIVGILREKEQDDGRILAEIDGILTKAEQRAKKKTD